MMIIFTINFNKKLKRYSQLTSLKKSNEMQGLTADLLFSAGLPFGLFKENISV